MAECPHRAFHCKIEDILPLGGSVYWCSCGCTFKWWDTFHWEVLEVPEYIKELINDSLLGE